MNVRRHEPGDVSHIHQQVRARLVGDLPEAVEVYGARIGAGAGDDHARLLPHRYLPHLVVVYKPVFPDTIVDEVIHPAAEVELHAVREMPAVREIHRENLLARLQQRRVGRFVGLAPRMRLHVGVFRPEEL